MENKSHFEVIDDHLLVTYAGREEKVTYILPLRGDLEKHIRDERHCIRQAIKAIEQNGPDEMYEHKVLQSERIIEVIKHNNFSMPAYFWIK
mmetsp:Transcript_21102/g.25677  ORF Transcript_21102/g.25677 Transcript_21102/m.25677 type:complete len:91 (-) Transcript_21102:11-283(-)